MSIPEQKAIKDETNKVDANNLKVLIWFTSFGIISKKMFISFFIFKYVYIKTPYTYFDQIFTSKKVAK